MKNYFFSYHRKSKYVIFIGDIFIFIFALITAYSIRNSFSGEEISFTHLNRKIGINHSIVIIAHIFSLYVFDLYNLKRLYSKSKLLVQLLICTCFNSIITSGILFYFPKYILGRKVVFIYLIITFFLIYWWRLIFKKMHGAGKEKNIAVVGKQKTVELFTCDLENMSPNGLKIYKKCILSKEEMANSIKCKEGHKQNLINTLLESNDIDILAFDSTNGHFNDDDIKCILQAKFHGIAIYDIPTLYENLFGKVPIGLIDGKWLLSNIEFQGKMKLPYIRVKRFIDVMLSLLLIIATAPLFVLTAISVILESRGGVFFIQERLGINKKKFRCFKFRTMQNDAEKISGPVWSKENDSRITKVGKFLRKTRIDELPQLWNILKGDMSFIGPRPIREYFANQLAHDIPFYNLRFNLKPGLSGWAQVNCGYAGSIREQIEKFEYELFYIQNVSFILDIITMAKTLNTVLKSTGK